MPAATDTTTWVAAQIRAARTARGWSQSELAERLERTQTAISYWEAGKRAPGLDDLLDLAGALNVPVEDLLPSDRSRRPVTAVLRATAERLAGDDLHAAIDSVVDAAEAAEMPPAEIRVTATSPSNAANELLEKAGVAGPPVNVDELARLCGLLVLRRPFPDSLSGLVFAYENGAVIGVNDLHHENRQRFSLAHECGHFILNHHLSGAELDGGIHLDSDDGTPPGFDWRAERTANTFAAELLMPRKFIAKAHKAHPDPSLLAGLFEVSTLAMGYRLVDLGLR